MHNSSLIKKLRSARSRECMVSFSCTANKWERKKKKQKMLSFSASHLSPLVVVRFLKMYNIKFRLVQRKKKAPKTTYTAALMKWHFELREGLVKTGLHFYKDNLTLGRYTPDRQFNIDSVPLHLRSTGE